MLAQFNADQRAQLAERAIETIRRDVQAGQYLKSEDVKSLTREQQEQIKQFGDEGVRQMVREAERRAEKYWGLERERDPWDG
jgi:hypothetical protein